MKRTDLGRLAFIAAALFILGAALARRGRSAPGPVKIAYLPIYSDLPLFVAQERGFFAARGVKVELVRFAASADMATALLEGAADAGASVAYSVVLAKESRDPGRLKIFMADSETRKGYLTSLVVRGGSPIKTVAGLKGKTLASFPGPTAVTFCKLVLAKHGLDPDKDVRLVELELGSHLQALESGRVDALFTYEPVGTQAVLEKGAVKLLPAAVETDVLDPWQAGVWVVSDRFLSSRPADAARVIAALSDAVDFARAQPKEAKEALGAYTHISAAVARATPDIPVTRLGEMDLAALQKQTDILFEKGVVSKRLRADSLLLKTPR